MRISALALLLALPVSGCSGAASWPRVLDPSDIVDLSEGTPRIRRIRDLGNTHIGQAGPLSAEADGQFAVGELVLVEGGGFGKQPTVRIGGRPAEVLWRTRGGGIIVRIPAGVPAGPARVSVQNAAGESEVPLGAPLRRLGALLDPGRGELHVVAVGGDLGAAPAAQQLGPPAGRKLPGARRVVISSDGSCAYVLVAGADRESVAIVDLMAPAGPQVVETRALTHPAYAIAAAERAPALALVGEEYVTLWDTREARRPAPWRAERLPEEARRGRAAALDPGGTLLAVAVPEGNELVVVDVKPGKKEVRPELVGRIDALPGARQPLLLDLRFASDGETVWVLSGDNPQSRPAGHQPTRLSAVHVGAPETGTEVGRTQRELTLAKTVELRDAGAPLRLALARALPTAAGTTIRTPPEKAALYFTTLAPEAPSGGAAGALVHAEPGGALSTLYSGAELLGGLDLTPDGALAVAASRGAGGAGLGVTVTHVHSGNTVTLGLAPGEQRPASSLPIPDAALQP